MTDILADVVQDLKTAMLNIGVNPDDVSKITVSVERRHRALSGGGECYICKVPDRTARRQAIAEQVARGGPSSGVTAVARQFGVSTWTVYDAVKAHPGLFRAHK